MSFSSLPSKNSEHGSRAWFSVIYADNTRVKRIKSQEMVWTKKLREDQPASEGERSGANETRSRQISLVGDS